VTQVNNLRSEWGYPNSARALSESAVRARAGPGRFGALSAVQRRCVGGNLRWSRIAPANPVRAVEAWLCVVEASVPGRPGRGQRVRASARGGPSHCLPGVSVMRRCGPRVRGPCRADHVGGPCRAGARRTGPGRAEPVRGRALYLP
jgi:hypothetical protein